MTRSAQVYREDLLVLEVTDRPGVLLSTAAPPPGGAPAHPFLNAHAFDPFSEGELANIVWASQNYDDVLARLRDAGFSVVEADETD
ncbi:MAG TPA: hypothetical protein VGL26_07345 [Jatrophihabitans sp.]|jgi:hypothetical protein